MTRAESFVAAATPRSQRSQEPGARFALTGPERAGVSRPERGVDGGAPVQPVKQKDGGNQWRKTKFALQLINNAKQPGAHWFGMKDGDVPVDGEIDMFRGMTTNQEIIPGVTTNHVGGIGTTHAVAISSSPRRGPLGERQPSDPRQLLNQHADLEEPPQPQLKHSLTLDGLNARASSGRERRQPRAPDGSLLGDGLGDAFQEPPGLPETFPAEDEASLFGHRLGSGRGRMRPIEPPLGGESDLDADGGLEGLVPPMPTFARPMTSPSVAFYRRPMPPRPPPTAPCGGKPGGLTFRSDGYLRPIHNEEGLLIRKNGSALVPLPDLEPFLPNKVRRAQFRTPFLTLRFAAVVTLHVGGGRACIAAKHASILPPALLVAPRTMETSPSVVPLQGAALRGASGWRFAAHIIADLRFEAGEWGAHEPWEHYVAIGQDPHTELAGMYGHPGESEEAKARFICRPTKGGAWGAPHPCPTAIRNQIMDATRLQMCTGVDGQLSNQKMPQIIPSFRATEPLSLQASPRPAPHRQASAQTSGEMSLDEALLFMRGMENAQKPVETPPEQVASNLHDRLRELTTREGSRGVHVTPSHGSSSMLTLRSRPLVSRADGSQTDRGPVRRAMQEISAPQMLIAPLTDRSEKGRRSPVRAGGGGKRAGPALVDSGENRAKKEEGVSPRTATVQPWSEVPGFRGKGLRTQKKEGENEDGLRPVKPLIRVRRVKHPRFASRSQPHNRRNATKSSDPAEREFARNPMTGDRHIDEPLFGWSRGNWEEVDLESKIVTDDQEPEAALMLGNAMPLSIKAGTTEFLPGPVNVPPMVVGRRAEA
ncbi:hypothetical protein CYMTET_17545 [Cymbomonas tetramitiformis]|uniref:Uncharacterized protein n=1 Tax=Cymbomonas tetramitiformis TaxID=36881 RepID=A0AAE0GA57_9CHLO|nr:hypothetical protein CYMTET_17545 [Cymbomonas tetramitiformis]